MKSVWYVLFVLEVESRLSSVCLQICNMWENVPCCFQTHTWRAFLYLQKLCEGEPPGMYPRKVPWPDWDEENQWERVWFPVGESSQSTHLNWKMLEVVEDYSSKAKSTGLNGVSLFWVCEGGLEKPNAWYMGVYMEQNRSCHLPALPEKPMGGVCTSFKQSLPQKQSASCQWRTKLEWSKESLLLLLHCLWINKSISQQDI